MQTTISDLLDVIHAAIIKNSGSNDIILEELQAIDEKIKAGKLVNYVVDTPFFRSIIAGEYKNI